MVPAHTTKQPGESITLAFDCSDLVPSGDSISSAAWAVYDSDDTDVSGDLLSGSASVSGSTVTQRFTGGSDGETYTGILSLTMASGDVIKDTLVIYVGGGIGTPVPPEPQPLPTVEPLTDEQRLARLRVLYDELANRVTQQISIGGTAKGTVILEKNLQTVGDEIERYERKIARKTAGRPSVNVAAFRRPR